MKDIKKYSENIQKLVIKSISYDEQETSIIAPRTGMRWQSKKLSDDAVKYIRETYGNGETVRSLAERFNVSVSTVRNCARGITYTVPLRELGKDRRFHVTEAQKESARQLRKQGYYYREIAEILGISSTSVRYAIINYPSYRQTTRDAQRRWRQNNHERSNTQALTSHAYREEVLAEYHERSKDNGDQ